MSNKLKKLFGLIVLFNAFTSFSQQIIYSINTSDSIFSCDIENVYIDGFQIIMKDTATLTPVTGSLISEDHTAEGFMVTLSSGAIVNFFRLDPGFWGNHTGNNARIVKRTSYNDGNSWGPIQEVFNDSMYDDRNVHGGLIGQDSIVLFFRRFDANYQTQVDLNYIYSINGGQTWSPRTVINSISNGSFGSNKIIKVPGRGWLMSIAGQFYVEIRISTDGLTWNNNVAYIWNYTYSMTHYIAEACFTYLGDGLLMGLFRNNFGSYGATYYQVTSTDNGYTWNGPDSTNIAAPFFCPAPQIFYDTCYKDLWVVATDRRDQCGPYLADSSSVWIYQNHIGDVFTNPMGYTLKTRYYRPFPNWYKFYGYSCYNRTAEGNYLVLFTESYKKANFLEDADLYQFNINYSYIHYNSSQYLWNTGDTVQFIHADTSGIYIVTSCDDYGHCATDSVFVELVKNIIQDTIFEINQGDVITLSADSSITGSGYTLLWSTGEQTTSIEVNPPSTTTYSLTVNYGYYYCTDSVTVTVQQLVTDIDRQIAGVFRTVPNPFTQFTHISFPNPGNAVFQSYLYDILGNLVRKEENINGNSFILYRGNLTSGVYILKLYSTESSFTSKLVINN